MAESLIKNSISRIKILEIPQKFTGIVIELIHCSLILFKLEVYIATYMFYWCILRMEYCC